MKILKTIRDLFVFATVDMLMQISFFLLLPVSFFISNMLLDILDKLDKLDVFEKFDSFRDFEFMLGFSFWCPFVINVIIYITSIYLAWIAAKKISIAVKSRKENSRQS